MQVLAKSKYLEPEQYLEPAYFYDFCIDILKLDLLSPLTHMQVCRFLTEDTWKKKMLMVPRETFKTTIGAYARTIRTIIREVVINDNPWVTILVDSAGKSHAEKTLKIIERQFQTNQLIKSMYGEFHYEQGVIDSKGKRVRDEYFTSHMNVWQRVMAREQRGVRENTVDTSGMGAEITGGHYHYVVADDWVTKRNYGTPTLRGKGIEHYKEIENVMMKDGGELLILCTPWIIGDAYSYILEHHDIDPESFDDNRTIYEGNGLALFRKPARWVGDDKKVFLFFPERQDEEVLDDLHDKLGDLFYTQQMCTYISNEQRRFKTENYQEVDPAELPSAQHYIISVDASGDSLERGECLDAVLGIATGYMEGRGFYTLIESCWAQKAASTEQLLDVIVQMVIDRRGEYEFINFERVTFVEWLRTALNMKFRDEGVSDVRIVTSSIPRDKTKIDRLSIMSYEWNQKRIFVNKYIDSETKKEIRDEFINFPKARHNDILDALEMGKRKLGIREIKAAEVRRDAKKRIAETNENGEVTLNVEVMLNEARRRMAKTRKVR